LRHQFESEDGKDQTEQSKKQGQGPGDIQQEKWTEGCHETENGSKAVRQQERYWIAMDAQDPFGSFPPQRSDLNK